MRFIERAKVAGLDIEFIGFNEYPQMWSDWKEFHTGVDLQAADLLFYLKYGSSSKLKTVMQYQIGNWGFQAGTDETTFGYADKDHNIDLLVTANKDWSCAVIETEHNFVVPSSFTFISDVVFRSRLPYYAGFAAHASIIESNGYAVMFSADSGVGKSTHAELWKKHLAAEIINGDYAAIRLIGGEPVIYGAPWSGTSPYKRNISAPLKAIVLLEQGDHNEITFLDPQQALPSFLPHCYLPYWHEPALAAALNNINSVLKCIPFYHLKCLPDKEAAELVRNTLFK